MLMPILPTNTEKLYLVITLLLCVVYGSQKKLQILSLFSPLILSLSPYGPAAQRGPWPPHS